MSKTAVNQVIQRAISDAAYRRQLQTNPGKALTGFDLSKDERAAITSGDPTRLTALGVDQRMSKAFSLPGSISDVSKSVAGDPVGSAGGTTFIDEASAASSAAIVSGAVGEGSSGLMAPDGTSFDAGLVSGEGASAATVTAGDALSVNAMNMRLIEGALDTSGAVDAGGSAIRDAHDSAAYSTGSAVRDAHDSAAYSVQADASVPTEYGSAQFPGLDASGSAIRDAHDAGAYSSGSALRDAHDSAAYAVQADATSGANATNLLRIENDLNTATAFEGEDAAGTQVPTFQESGDYVTGESATAEDTAADQISTVDTDAGGTQVPTGQESGDFLTE